MKNIKEQHSIIILIAVCILICSIFSFILLHYDSIAQYAYESIDNTMLENKNNDTFHSLKFELQKDELTYADILKAKRNTYYNELNNANSDSKDNNISIIETINETINVFEKRDTNLTSANTYDFNISPEYTCNELNYLTGNPCAACIEYQDIKLYQYRRYDDNQFQCQDRQQDVGLCNGKLWNYIQLRQHGNSQKQFA